MTQHKIAFYFEVGSYVVNVGVLGETKCAVNVKFYASTSIYELKTRKLDNHA